MNNPWDEPGVAVEIDRYWQQSEGAWRRLLCRDMFEQLGKGISVLDVGCGSGQVYGEMLRRGITNAARYYGMDISEEMLRLFHARFPEAPGRHRHVDSSRLPLDDQSWDSVICIHVVQHMADYGALLAELARVTKHNLYVVTWLAEQEAFQFDGQFYQNVYSIRGFVDSVLAARGGVQELRLKHLDGQSYSVTVRYQ